MKSREEKRREEKKREKQRVRRKKIQVRKMSGKLETLFFTHLQVQIKKTDGLGLFLEVGIFDTYPLKNGPNSFTAF